MDRKRTWAQLPTWITAAAVLIIAVSVSWALLRPEGGISPPPQSARALEVGQPFPELSLRNPYGELIPLSSLKGKVVLVEFWASYSKVCTEEHCYYFQPLYEQYREHGFEIYAVSVDSSAHGWIEGIERDALPWINVADIGEAHPEIPGRFRVEDLPTTYLLDQEGRIIARNVEKDDLEGYLEGLL